MIRNLVLATLAVAALATPALAKSSLPVGAYGVPAQNAFLADANASREAHQHLVRQGYANVSQLIQNEECQWVGTASKGGKTVIVGINLPNRNVAPHIN